MEALGGYANVLKSFLGIEDQVDTGRVKDSPSALLAVLLLRPALIVRNFDRELWNVGGKVHLELTNAGNDRLPALKDHAECSSIVPA